MLTGTPDRFHELCELLSQGSVQAPLLDLNMQGVEELRDIAEIEQVLPSFYCALARWQAAPKPIRAVAAVEEQLNGNRNKTIHTELLQLGHGAAERGMKFAVLKGAAWLMQNPGNLAPWRWMIDIDLLVNESQYQGIPAFLVELGYSPLSGNRRYECNFHHAPYAKPGGLVSVEVHRHLGWRHHLLPPEQMFEHSREAATGLLLPGPWCRLYHAIIHWQSQDSGLSRRTIRLKDLLDIDRLARDPSLDWEALLSHARKVGTLREVEAALALSTLLRTPLPSGAFDAYGRRHLQLALSRRNSGFQTWLARERWRAGTLWRCEKVAYRRALAGRTSVEVTAAVWCARLIRLPYLLGRSVGIGARAALMLVRQAFHHAKQKRQAGTNVMAAVSAADKRRSSGEVA